MCTNYTPTKKADMVKATFGVDLPNGYYQDEAYPNFLGPVVMKSHQTAKNLFFVMAGQDCNQSSYSNWSSG